MSQFLTFLHTSPVHIQTFNALLAESAPDLPVQHFVDESLLSEACAAGEVTPAVRKRVEETVLSLVEQGAAVVVCTCSTIGGVVESLNAHVPAVLMRIDRPMAEEAVTRGSRIIVAAALSTTLIPTSELIFAVAREAGKEVQVIELLCEAAWRQFERGDQAAYLREIAEALQGAAEQGDVIVLAQASMARAMEYCPELPIPVLSSPRSGLLAVIKAYRGLTC